MASINLSAMIVILFFLLLVPIKYWYTVKGENQSLFKFIKDLEGCHKGYKVMGIHKIKNYLQQSGYLSYSLKDQGEAEADHEDFDDVLEFAINTYQTSYNLEVSGLLDAKTVSAIVKPRCGVTDINNGKSRMRSSGISISSRSMTQDPQLGHGHGHGSLHTVSHHSFFPGTPMWPTSKTTLTSLFLPYALSFSLFSLLSFSIAMHF